MMTWRGIRTSLILSSALLPLGLAPARADDVPVEAQIVAAMGKVFGVHPGVRANHTKGVVVEGSFTATPAAAGLSQAALFQGARIPATVRFSDSTGVPTIPDGAPGASPHGMAIKFHQPDGSDVDMVINSLKFFPVRTGEEFRDLLLAVAASPPDAKKPTALDTFFASHPKAPAAFGSATTPESFATDTYNGVDAFYLVDKAGGRHPIRFQMAPERDAHLSPEEAAKRDPNFLVDELPRRLKDGPVTFHLRAQLADAGDPIDDATEVWPASRQVVDLGVLTIDRAVADSAAAEKPLLFMPTNLTDGIEPSDDPLIPTRAGAYGISFANRSQ